MNVVRASSEAEMIAIFLDQEFAHTKRYGELIASALAQEDADPALITNAQLGDEATDAVRRRVFARYRGYGTGEPSYLTDFPDQGVTWQWIHLTPDELLDTNYIRYEFWTDLSGGSRSPRVAAQRIHAGINREADMHDSFINLAEKLRAGLGMPPLIFVSADGGQTRVALEGHARLTAYAVAPEMIPNPIEVLLGSSADIAHWSQY